MRLSNAVIPSEARDLLLVRRRAKRTALLAVLLAFAAGSLWTTQLAAQSERAKQVGMHIKCMCKGCDMTAGGCAHPGGAFSGPCDSAKAELRQIDDLLAKGKSEQQIIDAFVAQYGTIAYVEPPKHGFGLVAWIMPLFYFLLGLALVVFIVRKWALRPAASSAAPPSHNEALDRARAQAARETED
jgi:cytochrome c-type biogenesis protein CcmH/NrfF